MDRKQKRAQLIAEAEGLVSKSRKPEGLTQDEAARFDEITVEVEKIDGDAQREADLAAKFAGFASVEVKEPAPAEPVLSGSLGERFVQSKAYTGFRTQYPAGVPDGSPVSFKAVVGKADPAPLNTESMGVDKNPPKWTDDLTIPGETTLLDLITVGTTSESYLPYRQVVSRTNNAAIVAEAKTSTGTTPEEGLKPLSTLTTQPADAKVATYADGMEVTNQELRDDGAIKALIDSTLRENLNAEVQRVLLAGSGTGLEPKGILNTTGVLNQAFDTDLAVTFRKAKSALRKTRTAVQALILNPEDAEQWDLQKDTTGRYLGAGPFATGPSTAWSVPIVESEALEPGKAIMGDFKHVHLLIRQALAILVFNQHKDYAQRNLNYVRAELAAMQLIRKPSSLCVIETAAAGA